MNALISNVTKQNRLNVLALFGRIGRSYQAAIGLLHSQLYLHTFAPN